MLLLLAGGGLFGLGVLAGTWIGGEMTPARAAEPAPTTTSGSEDLRALRELVQDLALEIRSQRVLERPAPRAPMAPPSTEPQPVSAREPIAIAPTSGAFEEILARLDRFEQTQRELLAIDRTSTGPGMLQPAVPPGMAVRDYLQALKDCGQPDEVKRAHLLWDMRRIRDAYGVPDEEADRGDYIEWIYKLPTEGTQFDFHFTGGLVIEAH